MGEGTSAADRARAILAGKAETPRDQLKLVGALHRERLFGLARRLLERLIRFSEVATDAELRCTVGQKLALSTYKDPDLPTEAKLKKALEILQDIDNLATTVNQETLGLAGAIHKRLWEYQGSESQLETSRAFYMRGYRQGVEKDYGYTGINAAFVLDLLANLEAPDAAGAGADLAAATVRQREAGEIRTNIVDRLPHPAPGDEFGKTWWYLVTLGEAYFGLGRFDKAEQWLQRAAALDQVPDWERESTARQLAALMSLMERQAQRRAEPLDPRARKVLADFLGNAEAALLSVVRGRVGLALSGGGFRASLYHIGVLARLAELDLLRHVEYLSCVSGGSIVGAHFYLEVRKLLTDKADVDITREDYIAIVERLSRDFLAGVQRNIRVRIAAEWTTNVKMIFAPNYSRTQRAGELYEKEIYSRVPDGQGDRPRFLNELKIIPRGEEHFRPKDHNWRRAAKVPILILNATSLNTGHNWQFTTSWMGEPPAAIDTAVDANYRLRRVYYEEAPPPNNEVRLGHAVAASACVPGIFEPLALVKLYERMPPDSDHKIYPIVRLVDGGVHDNQGTTALLEQGCSVLLVSDASGQMDHLDFPSNRLLGVPLRANSILQTRVRGSQYDDLQSRRRGGTLKGMMFVHLKKDLDIQEVDWIGCQERSDPLPPRELTSYGIQKGLQRRLAAIRTDLDSFSDVEASALMTSGYLATEAVLKRPILGFDVRVAPRSRWWFLEIEPVLAQPSVLSPLAFWLDSQLRVGSKIAFKVWLLTRRLQLVAATAMAVVALLLAFGVWQLYAYAERTMSFEFTATYGTLFQTVVGLLAAALAIWFAVAQVKYPKTLHEIALGCFMATVGFVVARLHLHVFDPLFLRQGSLSLIVDKTQQYGVAERLHGTAERRKSLERPGESLRKSSYAVQPSEGFLLSAKKNLDPDTEAKVTEATFGLSDNPNLATAVDPVTKLRLLQVPGTPWRIVYDVDEERQRVRIHHLARDPGAGSTGT